MMKTNFLKWLKATAIRTAKTFAETALAMIPVGIRIDQIDYLDVLAVAAGAALICVLSCVPGLPEVRDNEEAMG